MKYPAIQMHGPEHHYLVSSVLLASLRNLSKFKVDDTAFDEAISRGKRVLLGSCGYWGVCGAAAGIGIAVSIATRATMMSDNERSLSMQVVSEALTDIAKIGGPRCCKASTCIHACCGFARAIRSKKAKKFASMDIKRNVIHRYYIAVSFCQIMNGYCNIHAMLVPNAVLVFLKWLTVS